ncbi:MAG: signal transduction histidine kinase [Flavobacteriales bacterium]|jgi:signal transduction histidine kinase
MSKSGSYSGNSRILLYTFLTMIGIAIFIAFYSYYTQIALFQEKEMFKLDCIANAVSFKISGEDHLDLMKKYPDRNNIDNLKTDSVYQMYHQMLAMTVEMKDISTQMYTLTFDSINQEFIFGINSGKDPLWMERYSDYPDKLKAFYNSGAIVESYSDQSGNWISAFHPIYDKNGTTVAILQVDETMETFRSRARSQVWSGILIILAIIIIVGTLMFFSVKNILARQERLRLERQEIENMRKELVANVSHDLRTPLASIHGYIETLLMKKGSLSDEKFDKYLRTTLRSTEKLRYLVDELFELSKLESKERQLQAEAMSATDLIHDVMNNFKISAGEKNIDLLADVSLDLPRVHADIALLDRVLQNLIGNSIKFCNEGDRICVSAKKEGNKIRICVEDTGEGISQEELPYVFDRFHRGGTKKIGSGLGLAIVKGVLELHNSKYEVKSIEGKGTAISFTLPISE